MLDCISSYRKLAISCLGRVSKDSEYELRAGANKTHRGAPAGPVRRRYRRSKLQDAIDKIIQENRISRLELERKDAMMQPHDLSEK